MSAVVTTFCITPESLVIPVPVISKTVPGSGAIVKALAPELKTILLTRVLAELAEIETSTTLDTSKVAISEGPFGTVAGVQLADVFQSPSVGFKFQVALPPRATSSLRQRIRNNERAGMGMVLNAAWAGEEIMPGFYQ